MPSYFSREDVGAKAEPNNNEIEVIHQLLKTWLDNVLPKSELCNGASTENVFKVNNTKNNLLSNPDNRTHILNFFYKTTGVFSYSEFIKTSGESFYKFTPEAIKLFLNHAEEPYSCLRDEIINRNNCNLILGKVGIPKPEITQKYNFISDFIIFNGSNDTARLN